MAEHNIWLQAFNLWMSSLNDAVFDGTGTTGESYEITSVTQWFGATGWDGQAHQHCVYVTDSLLRVSEVLQGDPALVGAAIKVQQEGGETETQIIETVDVPQLARGQEVVLFLTPFIDGAGRPTDRYVILGLNDGLFFVRHGRIFPAVSERKLKPGIRLSFEQEVEVSALEPTVTPGLAGPEAIPEPFSRLEGVPAARRQIWRSPLACLFQKSGTEDLGIAGTDAVEAPAGPNCRGTAS